MSEPISLPRKILIDENAIFRLDDFLDSLNIGKSCLVVCDSYINRTFKPQISMDHRIIERANINKDSIEKEKDFNEDFVLAIGGGRTIDIGKYTAYLANKEWVAFPTTLSHDGIMSSRAVLEDNHKKFSVDAREPSGIIADLSIIKKAPFNLIASGAGDLLSKYSAVADWKLADLAGFEKYHKLLGDMSLLTAETVVYHKNDIKEMNNHGLEVMIWSLINAGFVMNIYGSSRPASGSEHNFSHALDELLFPNSALHGFQCCLGSLISLYLHNANYDDLRQTMIDLSIPTTAKDIGIPKETLVKALVMAKNVRDRYTILNEIDIDANMAEKILKSIGIV